MPALRVSTSHIEIPLGDAPHQLLGALSDGIQVEDCLRATALALDADTRICIISCDALALPREICDRIAKAIEEQCKIPSGNILISCTHTHHAPMTVSILGIDPDKAFTTALEEAAISAAKQASDYLDGNPPATDAEAELFIAIGNEATVGKNSRFILKNGGISWLGHQPDVLIRPTGPLDPDLPLILFRRPDGAVAAGIYGHANHNIGYREHPVSPGFYALAAREAETKYGGQFMFLPGALGSTHEQELPVDERILRVGAAIDDAMTHMRLGLFGPISSAKVPFKYRIRTFDEVAEDAAVTDYCSRYLTQQASDGFIGVFREMRQELAPHQGEERETWLQVLRLGDIAIVGVPGELFTSLGLEIKRRSPFRYTIVVAIANDYIGYLPDVRGFQDGGYQTWAGLQCPAQEGTGEAIVDAAVGLMERVIGSVTDDEPVIRDVADGDALPLQSFYNSLDHAARVTFRPMGWTAAFCDFGGVVKGVREGARYDVVIEKDGRILGWAFISGMEGDFPLFGIGVSEALRGQGFGRKIMSRVIDFGRRDRSNKGIDLTVVQTNDPARLLYESFGFRTTGALDGGDGLMYYAMRLHFDAGEEEG